MLKLFIGFFIFCIVLFLYLHVQFHLKTSDDLEVYEIEQASKDKLEEVCDLRQPILFELENDNILRTSSKKAILENYHAFEIKIRNSKDPDYSSEIYMPLPLHASVKLFSEDKASTYYSENNMDFLQETGVIKHMQYNDEFIRPHMVSNSYYDILMGSEGAITPFRHEINYRNYFLVTQGSVEVKLAPPKSSRYLSPVNDYENFEFRSPVNPWFVQAQYSADFDKMKCLDITLAAGKMLYIPAYWWYSIKFGKDSSITSFFYRTYMNNIAITPQICMYALQQQNVKREVVKKIPIEELSKPSPNIDKPVNPENVEQQIRDSPLVENKALIVSAI
jgi:hypothetical protein